MLQLNAAQLAQTASKTLGMVLLVTCDTNAGSLNFHKLDAVKAVSRGSIDELRFSGSVTLTADGMTERDNLRAAIAALEIELDGDESLGCEAILFNFGEVIGRVSSTTVEPSELL